MNLRLPFTGTGHDVSRWLMLLLLALGFLVPAACVLWFMNEAMVNQRDAARQQLAEAYRSQLQLVRERLDSDWEKRAADLDKEMQTLPAPAVFESAIRRGLADAVIVMNSDGTLAYPSQSIVRRGDPLNSRPDWVAARSMESQGFYSGAADSYVAVAKADRDESVAAHAMQAYIRCLLRAGKKPAAFSAIEESFSRGRLLHGVDEGGRSIAVDEQLLSLKLIDPSDALYRGTVKRLRNIITDYREWSIPSSQRLFAMDELSVSGDFPTRSAERLAEQFLEASLPRTASTVLQSSGIANVWKLGTPDGRVVGLFRTPTVLAAMRASIGQNRPLFDVAVPSDKASAEWTDIGGRFPGWRITDPLAVHDGVSAPHISRYVWIALLALAVVALAAFATAQALRRQWRLARLKTDLVAAVSHELKTPLASVRLLVETLLEDEQPEGRTREYLEMIARENLRLSRLIGNFLTFSRLERNLKKFDIRATSPERVIEAVVESAQERMLFDVEIHPNLPTVRADEDALVTVLLNLLDNAHKYTPDEKRIALRTTFRDGHVVFAVEDNGIGIAPKEQKKIFRRFYQVDRRLARESGGCGLGLTIVDFIVRAHGGRVEVESQPGKGSTFSVVMP